jgi:DNA-binding GntR family transcriptional regulator
MLYYVSNKITDKIRGFVLKKISLKEQVYTKLVEDIISGVYAPDSILTEKELMTKFECSKAPIREALIELCKDDYLKSIPRMGYRVVSCSLKEMVDILDFRVDLEISNLKRAFPSIKDQQLKELKNEYYTTEENALVNRSIFDNWKRNQNFHLSVCALSGNAYTLNALKNLLVHNSRFFSQYYSYAWMHNSESKGFFHNKIIEGLMQRDLETTCEILAADINSVKMQIQEALKL